MVDIKHLIRRSSELEKILLPLLNIGLFDNSDRLSVTRTVCSISLEYANSTRVLIETGNFTSATGLMRLQYEAIVRAVWLLYAASDIAVSKLAVQLTTESEQKAANMPMLTEMLSEINKKAPKQASQMLNEFKDVSGKAMNSFVHCGIHAINRHDSGYPLHLIVQIMQNSNALSTMCGMILGILSGDTNTSNRISKIQLEFIDCLPPLKTH